VSVVLLVGAGLLGRSLVALLRQNLGFRTAGVLVLDTVSPAPRLHITAAGLRFDDPSALARQARLNQQIMNRLEALPGVLDVGGVSDFPLEGGGSDGTFVIVPPGDRSFETRSLAELGAFQKDPSRSGHAAFRVASAGYFGALGIPLVRGRLFDDRDTPDAPHVAVISETLARTRWPNEDPIGLRIEFGGMDGDLRIFTIVGVVGDVRERGFDASPRSIFYADYRQRPLPTFGFTFVLRGAASAATIAGARRVLHDLVPEVPPRFRRVEEIADQSVARRRFTFVLAALFAGGGLLVAVLGLYGVMSFLVAERSREFAIRMALGARRSDIQRFVLGHAAALVAIGLTSGLVLSLAASRLVASQLFAIRPADSITYASVVAVLAATAFVACEVPAWRATRVDPARTLRADA